MESENIGLEKSLNFAVRVVNLCKYLQQNHNEYNLSKQLLRSGTSIGANLQEASRAISARDFISKAYISLKEASESEYWLILLHRTKYLTDDQYFSMRKDCEELIKIISTSTNTARKNLRKKTASALSFLAIVALITFAL